MSYKIVIPDHNYSKEAQVISMWTESAGTMLPKSPGELECFINGGRSVLVVDEQVGLVAHAAITFFWPDKWTELGAVVVNPEHRGKGWGSIVVRALLGMAEIKLPDYNLFALCNKHSLNLFLRNEGKIITDPNLLPLDVWGECNNCPNFQKAKLEGKLCCDTPVSMAKCKK